MRIEPDSIITLYKDVDIDNGEQLVFSSRENQIAYFESHRHPNGVYTPCTVVRKTGALRIEKSLLIVSQCNYLSFQNPLVDAQSTAHGDGKTVYARIIDYDYVNNECTEVTYVIDYWQTWMFDVKFEDSYIEREHLSEADAALAEENPYNPNIFEYRTGESLPISKDLEKLSYEIGMDSSTDGYKLTEALSFVADVDGTLGVLIKLANISFEDLDVAAPNNSQKFAQYLSSLIPLDTQTHKPSGGGVGFYWLTSEMGSYLHTRYPDDVIDNWACGDGWAYGGESVNPFYSSHYHPGCCWIYDPNGADFLNNCGQMGKFFEVLTTYGQTDSIIDMNIIPNNLMFLAARQPASSDPITAGQVTAVDLPVDSKKLMRFPFSYMRVIAPNGDVKELKYENFEKVRGGENLCEIGVLMDYTDRPTLIAAPRYYKLNGVSAGNVNILEALTFDQFPTMPYTIDAFTAQVAAVANYTIGNRTVDNAADMAATDTATSKVAQWITTIQNGLGAAATAMGFGLDTDRDVNSGSENNMYVSGAHGGMALAKGISQTGSMYAQGAQMTMNRTKFEAQSERWMTADSALSEGSGSAIAAQLNLTRPAYAADKYIASNGIGTLNFSSLSFCDLLLVRVSLSPEILDLYDNYFKHFGYTSGRCGIPRVINYSRGADSAADLPDWKYFNNKYSTYVKTMDLKVIHSMLPVASFIKNMFDSGVRMIKGDPSDG